MLAISYDPVSTLNAFSDKYNITYPLLADEGSEVINEPRHIDEIASSMGQSTSQALSTLLSLELKDLVKQHAGTLFVKL